MFNDIHAIATNIRLSLCLLRLYLLLEELVSCPGMQQKWLPYLNPPKHSISRIKAEEELVSNNRNEVVRWSCSPWHQSLRKYCFYCLTTSAQK